MTVMDLVQRVDALEGRALVLRDVLALLDRAFPRGDHNFVLVDGEKKRVVREVVEEVRRLLLSEECASWRERQDLLVANVDRVVPVKSKKSAR